MTKFRIQVVIRILLSLGFGFAAYVLIYQTPFWLLGGWMVLFSILSITSLVVFVEKSERELSDFLMAIKQNDFTNTYPQTRRNKKKLYEAFNTITSAFISLRGEKESNYHFLKTVVEHSGVPLIAYDLETEQITLANQAVKNLFYLPHFTKLDSLTRIDSHLVEKVRSLHSDEKVLLKLEVRKETLYLSVTVKELILQSKKHKVVAFHNINSELDQKEVESWQKLIRVLTHEIKNSVIPISTLAEVINDMFKDLEEEGKSIREIGDDDLDDFVVSIRTIEKRSKGLVKFVMSYGDLARVPKPQFEKHELCNLIRGIVHLEDAFLKKHSITLQTQLPDKHVLVNIDSEMIEQVLINLIKNAAEAMLDAHNEHSTINITLERLPQNIRLSITDNGPGVDEETLENVFVPFFTTKKEGSGIGLSLSKQIMRAHKGNIKVRSELGVGTTFELIW